MADLADLWGYDDEPPEEDDLPSSRERLQFASRRRSHCCRQCCPVS